MTRAAAPAGAGQGQQQPAGSQSEDFGTSLNAVDARPRPQGEAASEGAPVNASDAESKPSTEAEAPVEREGGPSPDDSERQRDGAPALAPSWLAALSSLQAYAADASGEASQQRQSVPTPFAENVPLRSIAAPSAAANTLPPTAAADPLTEIGSADGLKTGNSETQETPPLSADGKAAGSAAAIETRPLSAPGKTAAGQALADEFGQAAAGPANQGAAGVAASQSLEDGTGASAPRLSVPPSNAQASALRSPAAGEIDAASTAAQLPVARELRIANSPRGTGDSEPSAPSAVRVGRADNLSEFAGTEGTPEAGAGPPRVHPNPGPAANYPTGAAAGEMASFMVSGQPIGGAQTAPLHAPVDALASANAAVPLAEVAVEIAGRARDGKSRFEIRLDPPELGRIEVRLDIDRDGTVTSRLLVDRSETLDLLRRHAVSLERALEQAGLTTAHDGLEFSLRDHAFARHDENEPLNRAGPSSEAVATDAPSIAVAAQRGYRAMSGLGAGIDIRV
jgi:flagellar hook-length control protein FliK